MAWKTDEKGSIAVVDGNPVWIDESGAEVAADYKAATVKIATLNREAADRRTKLTEAETKLAAFAGISDPAEALKGMQFMASMDGKKVMDDEGIEKLFNARLKPIQDKLTASEQAIADRDKTIYGITVGEKIATSEFLKSTTYTPTDAKDLFSKNFKVEDGKTIGYDNNGAPIYNSKGETASVDEALKFIIDSRADKDHLYKASGANGSGQQQSNSTGGNDLSKLSMTELAQRQSEPAVKAYIETLK